MHFLAVSLQFWHPGHHMDTKVHIYAAVTAGLTVSLQPNLWSHLTLESWFWNCVGGGEDLHSCSTWARVKAAGLMCLVVIEQRPVGHVTANQSVFTVHVCIIQGTSHHGEGLFAVCVSIRQGERNSCPPPTTTYPTSKLSVLPSQERRKTEPALVCVHKLRQ